MQYAGIMKRSDGKCHLDENNEFSLAGEFVSNLQSWLPSCMNHEDASPETVIYLPFTACNYCTYVMWSVEVSL